MANLLDEQKLTLTQLAREEGVSVPTPWRWAKRGVRGVVLETFSIGGRRFTTREAYRRFAERCTAVATGEAPPVRTNRQRAAAIARAEAELDAAGV